MDGHTIDEAEIAAYAAQMRRADRAAGTRAKYLRDVRALRAWLAGRGLSRRQLWYELKRLCRAAGVAPR